jgi:formylmethanofuran dehydrogenase subunit E
MTPTPELLCNKCGAQPRAIYAGNNTWCKPCLAEYQRAYAKTHPRNNTSYWRKKRAKKDEKLLARDRRNSALSRERHPDKYVARQTLGRAVKSGKIVKPVSCSSCGGSGRLEGHHNEGYDKPLSVQWLCVKCHRQLHRALKERA